MVRKKLQKSSNQLREVFAPPPKKRSKNSKVQLKSAIFDIQVAGAEIWQAKFDKFLHRTTYDPALGYPVGATDVQDTRLDNGTVFDSNSNPLTTDSYEDLHGGDNDSVGIGGLGGGSEFSTGEILV